MIGKKRARAVLALLSLLSTTWSARSAPEDTSISQVWARENDYARLAGMPSSTDEYLSFLTRDFGAGRVAAPFPVTRPT